MLVRKDELACRNSWGSDLWVSATAPDSTTPEQPAAQLTEDIVIPPQNLDDVIESVVASDFAERPSTPASDDDNASAEDVVVGEASLLPEQREQSLPDQDDLAGINTAAHNDQAHRAQVIARGSLDAILQARERVQRRRGSSQRPTSPAANSADVPQSDSQDARPGTTQSQQAPENQQQRSPLERQRVQFGRAYNDPTPPVPLSETRGDERDSGSSGYDADIFDSVPEIDPAIELPHIDEATRRRIEQEQAADGAEGSGEILPEEQLSSYELVLQRARAIRAAARAERDLRPSRGGTTHKSGRQSSKRAPQALPRREQRHETTARPVTPRPVEDVLAQPKLEAKVSLPPETLEIAGPEVEDHANPGTQFDVNLLITPDVSFRRQRRTDPQPALDTPSDAPSVDDLETTDESVLPVPRRVPFFRRWKSSSARGQGDEYPTTIGALSDIQMPDEVDAETQAESQDWDVAASHIPDDEPLPAIDEPTAEDSETTGQAMTSVSEGAQASFGSGHPRDLYGYRQEAISSSRERRDDEVRPASPEPASSHWTRSDYRIRASRHAESSPLPDIDVGVDSDYQDLDTVPPVEDRYVLPLAEDQESTGGSDWSASWSFEPQTNLREADAMDAFRARLFGKTPAVREARPAAADFAPAVETRTEFVRAPEPAERTAVASLQRSPLRASSFSRPARQDYAAGEPIARVINQGENLAPRVNRLDTLVAEAASDVDLDFDQMPDADPDFDIREVLAHHGDLLDMTIDLAPELPRACRTCRDYRPAENGDRGWCANTYAFTHRQMVNADDLACQSTIGCWWLPYDEIWLPEEPVSTPTPRVAKMVTDGTGRKRSG
ncbi:MAG: hypothetical protein WBA63_13750 [Thermomicrobiales bacterium]